MRRLMEDRGSYQQDLDLLLKRSRNVPKKASLIKRDLDAKVASEKYRSLFHVPVSEKLDGQVECYLYTPFNKRYRNGKLYISQGFACFASHVTGLVSLVIPLRDVARVEKTEEPPKKNTVDRAILVRMKAAGGRAFVFGMMPDRDFVVEKLSELLAALEASANQPPEDESDQHKENFDDFDQIGPLSRMFKEAHDLSTEATKEILWEK